MATAPKTTAAAPTAEDKAKAKADKFRTLANKRVSAALDKIAVIGNLANKGQYGYTEEQVKAIHDALNNEVTTTMSRFAPNAAKAVARFEI